MIACVCYAISETAIRSAADEGRSLEEIVATTGAGSSCGCCVEQVQRIVREANGGRCPGCPGARCSREAA